MKEFNDWPYSNTRGSQTTRESRRTQEEEEEEEEEESEEGEGGADDYMETEMVDSMSREVRDKLSSASLHTSLTSLASATSLVLEEKRTIAMKEG